MLCSSAGFLLLSPACANVPFESGGMTNIALLSLIMQGVVVFSPGSAALLPLWKNLSLILITIIMIISFIIQGDSLVAFFTVEVKMHCQLQRFRVSLSAERMRADTGA